VDLAMLGLPCGRIRSFFRGALAGKEWFLGPGPFLD
jgi:hypothetical protein